mgnify:CR=1 FL=1
MALEPDPGIGAARFQGETTGSRRCHYVCQQSAGRAGSTQGWFGLHMGDDINSIHDAVFGLGQVAAFHEFETALFLVIDHRLEGSRYIQGNVRPMGMIQAIPATG